jgi:receptor protein-tyrosine kinase
MKFPFFSSTPVRGTRRGPETPGFTPLDIFSAQDDAGDLLEEPDDDRWSPDPEPSAPEQVDAPTAHAPASPPAATPVSPVQGPGVQPPGGERAATRAKASAGAAATGAPRDSGAQRTHTASAAEPPEGTIGAILVAARRISIEDTRRVVASQQESDAPFGETAMRLGLASADDIHFALSRQFSMSCLADGDPAVDPEVVAAFNTGHDVMDVLRRLRGQIAMSALAATPPLRSIAITSAERRVGRSYIAANLATVFAQLGARTLLIDADFINPRQHGLFKVGNRTGLSSILAGRADLRAVHAIQGLSGLAVLPSGPLPPNPHDLVARPLFGQFLRRCEQDFDVILIDTPAWNQGSSARMVAAAAGAAMLLVQPGKTAVAHANSISAEIASVNARLLGAVLNQP